MEKNNEQEVEVEESFDVPEVEEGQEDTTDWKAEATKLREKAIAQRERTKSLKQQLAEAKKPKEDAASQKSQPSTSKLDETQLDFLDVKGISEQEDIDVIERVVQRTGQTVRQALKDDYVQEKLKANAAKREVKDAMPSSTKRGGSQSDGFELALDKFEKTGELPTDFALRSRVVKAKYDKARGNAPSWHS